MKKKERNWFWFSTSLVLLATIGLSKIGSTLLHLFSCYSNSITKLLLQMKQIPLFQNLSSRLSSQVVIYIPKIKRNLVSNFFFPSSSFNRKFNFFQKKKSNKNKKQQLLVYSVYLIVFPLKLSWNAKIFLILYWLNKTLFVSQFLLILYLKTLKNQSIFQLQNLSILFNKENFLILMFILTCLN